MTIELLTPERLAALLAGVLALAAAVEGGRALARSGKVRREAIVALVLGPLALVIAATVVITADGGLGTGNGLGGAVVAMILASTGTILGGLALARSRRVEGTR